MRALRQRYRVLRELSGPRAAAVFEAEDLILGGRVAVKTMPVDHDHAHELRDEALRHAALRHPRLVPLVGRFEDCEGFDDKVVLGLATRWADGHPLDRWAAERPLPDRLAAMAVLLDLVAWLHRRRWLHLDIKPDNVLGTADGPMMLDLGTARPVSSGTRSAGGTLGFAAPEVVRGEAPAETSDLFSLGVLFYLMLGGRFDDAMVREFTTRGRSLPSLRGFRPDLPASLVDLVDGMRSAEPKDRPSSCREASEVLASLGASMPTPTPDGVGDPAFVGRAELLSSLTDRLASESAVPTVVVGARGSGRMRLSRELLGRHRADDASLLLDGSHAPGMVLNNLLGRAGAPGNGDLHDPRLGSWLARGPSLRGVLLLGRMEEWDAGLRSVIVERAPDLAAAGLRVVTCAEALVPGFSPVGLGPLGASELRTVATEAGLDAFADVGDAIAASEGRPGRLLDRLLIPAPSLDELPPEARRGALALAWLPLPVPPAVVTSLAEPFSTVWAMLADRGMVQRRGVNWWHSLPVRLSEPPPAEAVEVARRALSENVGLPNVWKARLGARTGLDDDAIAWLDQASPALRRDPAVSEVAQLLARRGHPWAVFLAGLGAAVTGQRERTTAYIDQLPESHPLAARLRSAAWSEWGQAKESREYLEQWLREHPDHPEVRGRYLYNCAFTMEPAAAQEALDAADADLTIDADWRWSRMGLAARFAVCVRGVQAGGSPVALQTLVAETRARFPALDQIDPLHLWWLRYAARTLGDRAQALALARGLVQWADRLGDLRRAAEARLAVGAELHDFSHAEEARRAQQESLSLYERLEDQGGQIRVTASLAELEIHTGRLAAAEVLLHRFEDLKRALPPNPEAEVRGRVLWAAYHSVRQRPDQVLRLLEEVSDLDKVPPVVRMYRDLYLAEAYVELGAFEQALALLDALAESEFPSVNQRIGLCKGRAHIGIGRGHLQTAVPPVDEDPDPLEKETFGLALLAAGGEDLDPASFGIRRKRLERAAELLEGDRRVRAAALRDRLLEGPGAALDQIVRLVEAVGRGSELLEVVTQVVADALGAHRVLVMLRLPGLGRQLTSKEISGQETAGLAPEIWRRVRRIDDVWLADDAFADPNLRRLSATVRTFQVKSVVAVAIPKNGEVIGALYVDDIHRVGRFGPKDVEVLQRIARAIGDVAEALPAAPPPDGLTVHDLQGLYTCDDALAARSRAVFERVRSMRQSNMLLTGPTGAGKTWMAKRIAQNVLGANGLIEVVLRPGPTEMLVSQLWGTRPGDFTGAVQRKGAIFQAWNDNAVLFLDELQNLDEVGQRVLLPLLELPRRRFGSLTSGVSDLDRPLHIILGTNAAVDDNGWVGVFREDLWWRVSSVRIDLPPLSKRGREAVYRHLEDMLRELGLPAPEEVFERDALQRLATHTWPGNLRSLSDLAERAAMHYRNTMQRVPGAMLRELGLDRGVVEQVSIAPTPSSAPLVSAQARTVLEVLGRHEYVQSTAAAELGMSKFALHRLLKRLELLDHVRDRRSALRR